MQHKKKILIIIGTFRTGGKERQISELVKGLAKYDYEIYFYSRNIIAHYFSKFEDFLSGYKNGESEGYNKKTILEICNYIKKINPDIIHSWSTETSFIVNTYNLIKFGKYKIIDGSIRDSFHYKKFSSGWWQRKFCNILSSKIVSNTEAGLKSYKCPAKKSKCVYNGISLERFTNTSKEKNLEIEKKGVIVGMVATYCDKKDYETFIEAGIKIINKYANVQFIGIGNKFEDYHEKFLTHIPENYKESILLLSEKSNIEDYIQLFDIGVLLTNKKNGAEGISNSIMEYMISGKPVIATNLGGTPEIVRNSENGFLVLPSNVKDCVEKISMLIENDNLRTILSQNAKETIIKNFTFDKMITNFISIYKTVLK